MKDRPWLRTLVSGQPHFVIGARARPYMLRWHVLPPNDWLNVYVHKILRDDDDRALHDHPWNSTSFMLAGQLREITPDGDRILRAGNVVRRPAEFKHRLEVVEGPVWTLFFTGRKRRIWGFWCPQGFVPWNEFVDPLDSGQIGPGCDAFRPEEVRHQARNT